MNLLDGIEVTEKEPLSSEEEARLEKTSDNSCPYCSCSMTVGEDECLGCCGNCWEGLEE